MKPKIFVGSSVAGLPIAYSIQENLEYDAEITVWNQGVFNLTSNTLDDLINAIDFFDFGIFVFNPDDIVNIKNQNYVTVRDNVVFELGLFIGGLGKERVFFLLPRSINDFHLPSDLTGITPGTYDDIRQDNNLKAALGPFCSQVSNKINLFGIKQLDILNDENERVKKIVMEKKEFWQFHLIAELILSKMTPINLSYSDLNKGLVFQKTKKMSSEEFILVAQNILRDFIRLIELIKITLEEEIFHSFDKLDEVGSIAKIKNSVEKLISWCKQLLVWEQELRGIVPPPQLSELAEIMRGWTGPIIDKINNLPEMIYEKYNSKTHNKDREIILSIKFDSLKGSERFGYLIEEIINQKSF
ncbi:MAG: nucleotide-binding protein [Bacteroidetes bacterium]|nr:nucleotide-binding protein [Bacteroidota bacterium]